MMETGPKRRSDRRFYLSFGEVMTLVSGLFVAAGLVFAAGQWKSTMEAADTSLMRRVNGLHEKADNLDGRLGLMQKDVNALDKKVDEGFHSTADALAALSARLPIQHASNKD